MPGFAPVGSAPIGATGSGPPPVGLVQISEQSVAVAIVNIPNVVITEQSIAIAMVLTPIPRRRSGMLIG
jgi:hypothetical protein